MIMLDELRRAWLIAPSSVPMRDRIAAWDRFSRAPRIIVGTFPAFPAFRAASSMLVLPEPTDGRLTAEAIKAAVLGLELTREFDVTDDDAELIADAIVLGPNQ